MEAISLCDSKLNFTTSNTLPPFIFCFLCWTFEFDEEDEEEEEDVVAFRLQFILWLNFAAAALFRSLFILFSESLLESSLSESKQITSCAAF